MDKGTFKIACKDGAREVTGYTDEIAPGIKAGYHKEGRVWACTELTTGLCMSPYGVTTRKAAREGAKRRIEQSGLDKILKLIADAPTVEERYS